MLNNNLFTCVCRMDEDFDEVSSDSGTSHSEGELENEEGSPVTKKMKFK